MDFAIAPAHGLDGPAWEVLYLRRERGVEVAARLASFGYRAHAEAFLNDLIGGRPRHESGEH